MTCHKTKSIQSPPCPYCGQRIALPLNSSPRMINARTFMRHYLGDCPQGSHFVAPVVSFYEEMNVKIDPWNRLCYAAVVAARPKPVRLSPRELLRRQRRAGLKQHRFWKALGGRSQSLEDKSKGGLKGMHTRWHVKRNVICESCEFCESSRRLTDGERAPHSK
jgi:hypothetical protein